MQMGEALIARLRADAGVTAIAGTRLHWQLRPQTEALPSVVLTAVSESRPQTLKKFEDMATARIQASCFASTYSGARILAEAVIAAVVGPAVVTDTGGDDIIFWRADIEGPRDLGNDTETGFIHQAAVDLIIRYGKAA